MEQALNNMINEIFGVKVEVNFSDKPNNEIILPTNAWGSQATVTVNVHEIKRMSSTGGFDPALILDMYNGQRISIKYTFSSRLREDMEKIVEMRRNKTNVNRKRISEISIEF